MYLRISTILTTLCLSAVSAYSQSSQTFTGTISDSMCGAKHMMANVTPAQCTRECVKGGSDYALVSGGKVYTLKGDTKDLDRYAGENVKVTGTLSGTTLTVNAVSPSKS